MRESQYSVTFTTSSSGSALDKKTTRSADLLSIPSKRRILKFNDKQGGSIYRPLRALFGIY
jgi:hypothetical protein